MAASDDYHHGDMEIREQERTFSGFMHVTVWGSALVIVLVLGLTLAFAVGLPWMVSTAIAAVVGLAIGFFLRMGMGWTATVIGLAILAGVVGVVFEIARAVAG